MAKIFKGQGYFDRSEGTKGELSSINTLQDGEYFQYFSYVIRSNISNDQWEDIIKNTVHPAGMKVFGEINFSPSISAYLGRFPDYQNYTSSVGLVGPATSEITDSFTVNSITTVYSQNYVFSFGLDGKYAPYFGEDYVARSSAKIEEGDILIPYYELGYIESGYTVEPILDDQSAYNLLPAGTITYV